MTRHTAVPVWAGGGTGSVRVLGMQTSTDVTKHPDALEASGARSEGARMRGGIQCRPVESGSASKTGCLGLCLASCTLTQITIGGDGNSEKPLFLDAVNRQVYFRRF